MSCASSMSCAPFSLHLLQLSGKRLASLAIAAGLMGVLSQSASALTTGNLLTDPGFETNPIIPISQVLGSPFTLNAWGYEASTVTGAVGGVSPSGGVKMLSMTDDGNVATQTLQEVDVSAFAASINSGAATGDCSALFNVDSNLSAAKAEVFLQFMDSSHTYIGNTNINSSATLDSNPSTWAPIGLTSVPIPANTTYLVMQVVYLDSSLLTSAGTSGQGFVDDAKLTLTTVPEPASLGLVGVAAMGLLRNRRRK